ncbi:carbon-nitrogen hydrolase family protein [Homoserinimonas sp. A447]
MTRVAVAQVGSRVFDTPATMQRLRDLVADATAQQVEFLVFPEAFIGGYPKGLDFGAVVGSRTPEGRDDYRRYFDSAVTVPGPETEEIGELAAAAGMTIVVGVIERDGGTLYCTAVYLGADGSLVGKHRKLMPTASERLIWGQGDGSTLEVFDSPAGRYAATICWENYMPQLRLATYEQGIQLWCAPTVDDREIWQSSMRHIAYEGRMFVLSACQYLTRADCPDDYDAVQGNDPETELIRGGSVIVSPLGEVLAGPVYGKSTLLVADIDLADQVRGKYDLDVTGHYSRPDVFQLSVNTEPRASVRRVAGVPAADSPVSS